MTSIYWILQHVSDLPERDDWLSPAEREVRARLWAPKRVRDWRLGRWTAKQALLTAGERRGEARDPTACATISILATEAGVPYAVESGRESEWALSLSHAGEHGLCVLVRRPAAVGCDIETIGRRGEEFVVDWFTDTERVFVDGASAGDERSMLVTAIWSAKESALKALGIGLRRDTRDVEVDLGMSSTPRGWSGLTVRAPEGPLHGWWRIQGSQVLTIVSDPIPAPPTALGTRDQERSTRTRDQGPGTRD